MTSMRVVGTALGALTLLSGGSGMPRPEDIRSRAAPCAVAVSIECRARRGASSSLQLGPALAGPAVTAVPQAPQRNPCSKPKVYVKIAFVEGVEQYLNQDRGPRTDQEWLDHISQTAVDWLRASGGEGVDVIPHEEKVFVDDMPDTPEPENSFSDPVPGEYVFRLYLGLADRRDPMTGVRDRTKTDYLAQASLSAADPFGTYVGAFSVENANLEKAIGGAISRLIERGLTDRIDRYEATHGSVLRDPKLTASLLGREWVSPEPDERDTRILALATDCLGRRFDRTHIYYEHSPGRGKVDQIDARDTIHFAEIPLEAAVTNITGSVQLKYTLEKGTEAGSELIEISVAGRGQRRVRQVVFVHIKGLLLEVRPARTHLAPGEQTNIHVRLFKTTEKDREPIPGRRIAIAVEGLADGSVAPSGAIMTNEQGEATLNYKAGRSEQAVKVVATYQPVGYKEHVTGSGTVTVAPPTGDLELVLVTDATQQGECKDTQSGPPPSTTTSSFARRLHAQYRVTCNLDSRRDGTGALNERVIRERYVCTDPLLTFTYTGSAESVRVSRTRSSNTRWTETLADASLVGDAPHVTVELDPATRKVESAAWGPIVVARSIAVTRRRTSAGGSGSAPQESIDTSRHPFTFIPPGTFAAPLSSSPFAMRAPGPIPMIAGPVVGLPIEFGDGSTYVGGTFSTTPPPTHDLYFDHPPVCGKEASQNWTLRWEVRRRTKS